MFISPMLLTPTDTPITSADYIVEPKIDGIRMIASKNKTETRLWTRHHTEITRQFPELWSIPIKEDAVLDGELAFYNDGNFDFDTVMDRFRLQRKERIDQFALNRPCQYIVWDILQYKGQDLRSLSLIKRKEILHTVLSPHKLITPVLYLDGMFGSKLADETQKRNIEGVAFKRKNSTYKSGRHKEWMKLVHYKTAEVIIGGYRKEKFGWLLRHPETLEPLGIMELGTNLEDRKRFAQQSKPLITGEDSKYVYIEPSIRIRVKFPRYSRNGYLRTPSFQEFIS